MKKLTKEQFIEKAKKIHGNKYDYSLVEYKNNTIKVKIICSEHGIFEQRPNTHKDKGNGCPKCSGNYSLTHEELIDRFKEIHGNKYDYSKINYVNAHTKICIVCPIHGEFWQNPYGHFQGYDCKKCSNIIISKKNAISKNEFIDRSNIIHNNKYDYSLVEYKNNRTNVIIICPIHGEFKQRPSVHMYVKGECKKCGYEKVKIKNVKSLSEFISQANIVHGLKYDYSKVNYINSNCKINIICLLHGEFYQKPYKHLQNQGCPICKESKLENQIRKLLEKNNIKFINQYSKKNNANWLGLQSLDFYLPNYNVAIECQGEQHFKPVDFGNKGNEYAEKIFNVNFKRDKKKYDACIKHNIKILYFTDKIDCLNGAYFDIVYIDENDLINSIKNHTSE